ncbi:phenylacetaldehyde reductase [Gossypium hirsutum]|uniref:Phenylacetaldehyde reductase n=1 Tax=Gossypium hirsutum TaxID=3635 RepID=A0ABM2ZT54_GOSHI|nr:phenylacetaldehyde reductase-like [Gossypium hirsutum]
MHAKEEVRIRRVEPSREVVCVLGASGYITSWLVNLLLQHEYSINATVRDPHQCFFFFAFTIPLSSYDLKKIELIEEGSFDLVVEGCIGVFHTASLCYFDVKDPQAEMVEPVVKGTLNVLGSYAKVPSIKGVLITFSIAAVILIGKPLADDVVVDETWFSDPIVCEKLKVWYMLSKTLAKKVDWKFVEENGINMVTINPCMVLGPLLRSTLNASVEPIVNLVGGETFLNATSRWVNVRYVTNAYILVFETLLACGRYYVAEKSVYPS